MLLAAEPDDLGEIVDLGQVVGLDKAVISEADPRLLIGTAQLLRHGSQNAPGHAAMRHHRYHSDKQGILRSVQNDEPL